MTYPTQDQREAAMITLRHIFEECFHLDVHGTDRQHANAYFAARGYIRGLMDGTDRLTKPEAG